MKIRTSIIATSAFVLSASVCFFQVERRQLFAQGEPDVSAPDPAALKLYNALPESVKEERQKKGLIFQTFWKNARDFHFKPEQNNGDRRAGLKLSQLPIETRKQAEELASQYQKGIYPILKSYVARHNGLLPDSWAQAQELRPYVKDMEYKGTGPYLWGRGSWFIGYDFRLDGTMIARELPMEAGKPPTLDVWSQNARFIDSPNLGQGFIINGWNDGQVTFDAVKTLYVGTVSTPSGPHNVTAPPGQSGIPSTLQTKAKIPSVFIAPSNKKPQ